MLDSLELAPPEALGKILADSEAAGFAMSSEARTGALLRVLAASRPHGSTLLELGTGTGTAAAWMLDGLGEGSRLVSVDTDGALQRVAEQHLGSDDRLELHLCDAAELIRDAAARGDIFDLIFADTWPGKFTHLDETLQLVRPGGLYVVDDLLMQPSWPDDHVPKVFEFLNTPMAREDFHVVRLNWSTGILIATKKIGTNRISPKRPIG